MIAMIWKIFISIFTAWYFAFIDANGIVDFAITMVVFNTVFSIFGIYFKQIRNKELRKKESLMFKIYYIFRM
jgi:Ca2+/Na+ antiporter